MDAGRDQHICDLLLICLGPSLPLFFLFFLNFLRPLLPTLHLWPIMASPAFLKLPLNVLVQIPERDWLAQLIFLSSPWSNHWRGRCSLEEVRERGAGQLSDHTATGSHTWLHIWTTWAAFSKISWPGSHPQMFWCNWFGVRDWAGVFSRYMLYMLLPQLRNPTAGCDTLRKPKKLDSKLVGKVGSRTGRGGKVSFIRQGKKNRLFLFLSLSMCRCLFVYSQIKSQRICE